MGIFDEVKNTLNSGAAAAGRGTRSIQLKGQLSNLDKQRSQLMAQLGASLYEEIRNDKSVRSPREALFVSIEQVDAQRTQINEELLTLAQQSQQAEAARTTFACPQCGKAVSMTSKFCVGCGYDIQSYLQAFQPKFQPAVGSNAPKCAQCGGTLEPEAKFCVSCGTPVR